MSVKEVANETDYKAAISSSNLVALHFQASWAPECETVSAVLQVFSPVWGNGPIHLLFQELLKEAGLQGKLECFQLEAEKLPEVSIIILFKNREHLALIFSYLIQVSLKHEIVAVPTVILFRAGKAVDR